MVNKSLKIVGFLIASISSVHDNISEAQQDINYHKPVYYFGIQGEMRRLNHRQERFGKPLFKDNHLTQAGLLLGTIFNKYIGSELSYQTTVPKKHQQIVKEGEFSPGAKIPLDRGEFAIYEVKQQINSVDLGLMGYLPFFCENNLFGTVGISFAKITAKMKFAGDELSNTPSVDDINLLSKIFQQKKIIPFIKIGIQHPISEQLDLRFFIDWRNLSKFKIQADNASQQQNPIILKYKNSLGYGLALNYRW